MKNKKALYILIPATLLIWVLIILRIANYTAEEPDDGPVVSASFDTGQGSTQPDTFSIVADYRDPFLGRMARAYNPPPATNTTSNPKQNTNRKTTTQKPQKEVIRWPAITYKGMIRNQETKKEVYVLEIQNVSYLMNPGKEEQGVMLVKAFSDSVQVGYKKEKKFIVKDAL